MGFLFARAGLHGSPEWQVIPVVVAVVFQAALLNDKPSSIRAVPTGVPALRGLSRELRVLFDRKLQILTFFRLAHVLVMNPALAVAGNFVAVIQERLDNVRVSGHRHSYSEYSQRQLPLPEFFQDAPDAGTGSVLIERLHTHVPAPVGLGANDVREKGL